MKNLTLFSVESKIKNEEKSFSNYFKWCTCIILCWMWNYISGSNRTDKNSSNINFWGGYFTVITEWNDTTNNYQIIYANDTKVKYFAVTTGYKFGITPLYNADGTLQVFEK